MVWPMALWAALGKAAHQQVLFRQGDSLSLLAAAIMQRTFFTEFPLGHALAAAGSRRTTAGRGRMKRGSGLPCAMASLS